MEDKQSGGGSLLGLIIVIAVAWFAYDNLFAKHWTVNYAPNGGNWWTIDIQSPKFRKQTECADYAASMTTVSELFHYSCGYKYLGAEKRRQPRKKPASIRKAFCGSQTD
jgi:hypothetical protein